MKCNETHCHTCGYDYDDMKFVEQHSRWPIIDASLRKQIEEFNSRPTVLDPDLLDDQMLSITKAIEDNISAQKLCGECLKPRPFDIEDLLKEGWNIVQKPMTSTMDNNTMQLVFHIEQWWLCKKCQENL